MMNHKVCEAILDNIQNSFSTKEMVEFRKNLCELIDGTSDLDVNDLCDCILVSAGKDIHLDTSVRDKFYDAYLKMHIG